jgi:tellurite resistance protein TehA-like permease
VAPFAGTLHLIGHWAWYPDRVKKRLKKPVLNKILGCKSATDKFCIVDKNLDNY